MAEKKHNLILAGPGVVYIGAVHMKGYNRTTDYLNSPVSRTDQNKCRIHTNKRYIQLSDATAVITPYGKTFWQGDIKDSAVRKFEQESMLINPAKILYARDAEKTMGTTHDRIRAENNFPTTKLEMLCSTPHERYLISGTSKSMLIPDLSRKSNYDDFFTLANVTIEDVDQRKIVGKLPYISLNKDCIDSVIDVRQS